MLNFLPLELLLLILDHLDIKNLLNLQLLSKTYYDIITYDEIKKCYIKYIQNKTKVYMVSGIKYYKSGNKFKRRYCNQCSCIFNINKKKKTFIKM